MLRTGKIEGVREWEQKVMAKGKAKGGRRREKLV